MLNIKVDINTNAKTIIRYNTQNPAIMSLRAFELDTPTGVPDGECGASSCRSDSVKFGVCKRHVTFAYKSDDPEFVKSLKRFEELAKKCNNEIYDTEELTCISINNNRFNHSAHPDTEISPSYPKMIKFRNEMKNKFDPFLVENATKRIIHSFRESRCDCDVCSLGYTRSPLGELVAEVETVKINSRISHCNLRGVTKPVVMLGLSSTKCQEIVVNATNTPEHSYEPEREKDLGLLAFRGPKFTRLPIHTVPLPPLPLSY